MSIRLTKALREEIAKNIYKASDLPARLEELEKLPKAAAADLVRACWPEGFAEAAKNHPQEWFGAVTTIYINRYTRRGGVGEYIDISSETVGSIYDNSIYLDDPIPFPAQMGREEYVIVVHEWLYDTYRPMYQAWAADKQKLADSVWALLNSYRTMDMLLKAAPEMKQFIPNASVSYPPPALPISNVIATLLERGVVFQTT